MRWGYKSYQSKFYFSEREIDFTAEYLDYRQFLLQEFFTADTETRKNLSRYYIEVYGPRSFAYLSKKYSEWANGNYHLTDLMKERILYLMPQFLNEKAKHKLGIHEFMAAIKSSIKSFESSQKSCYKDTMIKTPKEIVALFEKELEKIKSLSISNFRYNVLTEAERTEAVEICKYILEIKLQKIFDQIERDFNVFLPYMSKFKRGIFAANYSITAFNLKVDITNPNINDITIPEFKIKEIETNSRFRQYSDKYLAYELVSIHKDISLSISNSFLNANDLHLFFNHYETLLDGHNEVNMNSNFRGEGGILILKAQLKPLKLVKTSIIVSSVKLAIYSIVTIGLISLAINYKLFTLLIFGGIFFASFSFGLISDEIKQLKSLTKQLKTYG